MCACRWPTCCWARALIDVIVPEPVGGAHRSPQAVIKMLGDAVETQLATMDGMGTDAVRDDRRAKFLAMGR